MLRANLERRKARYDFEEASREHGNGGTLAQNKNGNFTVTLYAILRSSFEIDPMRDW